MEMINVAGGPLEIKKKTNKGHECSHVLKEILTTNYLDQYPEAKAYSLAICIHHGETDANKEHDAYSGKNTKEPLNQIGQNQIRSLGEKLTHIIPQELRKNVRIHVSDDIMRNKETAQIIQQVLGLDNDAIIESEVLRSGNKGKNNKGETVYTKRFTLVDNEYGTESTEKVRAESADYMDSEIKENPNLIHIFITNRVSYKGFEDRKKNVKATDYSYAIPTGVMDIVPINKKGEGLLHKDNKNLFHYDEKQAVEEILQLAKLVGINEKSLPSSLDEMNEANALWMKLCSFLDYALEKKYYNIIVQKILLPYPVLQKKVLKHIFVTTVQNGFDFCRWYQEECFDEKVTQLLCELAYEYKEQYGELWKKLCINLIGQGKQVDGIPLLEIKYINDLVDNYHTIVNQPIQTIAGKHKLSDIYVEPIISYSSGNDTEYFNSDSLVVDIINEPEKIFMIQGPGGSGKSLLTKKLISNFTSPEFIANHNLWDYKILNGTCINKNYLETSIPNNQPCILIIDALDEKEIVQFLKGSALFMKYPLLKIVITSRYFGNERNNNTDINKKEYFLSSGLQKESVREEYIEKYRVLLDSRRNEEIFVLILKNIQNVLGTDFSPILIAMIVSIIDNRSVRKRLLDANVTREDIYEIYVDYLMNHAEKRQMNDQEREKFQENKFNKIEYETMRLNIFEHLAMFCRKNGNAYPYSFIQMEVWRYIVYNNLFESILGRKITLVEQFVLGIVQFSYSSVSVENNSLKWSKKDFIKQYRDQLSDDEYFELDEMSEYEIVTQPVLREIDGLRMDLCDSLFEVGLFQISDVNIFGSKAEDLLPHEQVSDDEWNKISTGYEFMHKSLQSYFGYQYYLSNKDWVGFITRIVDKNHFSESNNPESNYISDEKLIEILMYPHFNGYENIFQLVKQYKDSGVWDMISQNVKNKFFKELFSEVRKPITPEFLELFEEDDIAIGIFDSFNNPIFDMYELIDNPNFDQVINDLNQSIYEKNYNEVIHIISESFLNCLPFQCNDFVRRLGNKNK